MQMAIDNETLKLKIKMHMQKMIEARQVAARARKLLPSQLRALTTSELDGADEGFETPIFKKNHKALVSDSFVESVDELAEISYEYYYHKIMFETHMMLFDARRTIAANHRRKIGM